MFTTLFGLIGLIAGLALTPVPNNPTSFGCTGFLYSYESSYYNPGAARWCEADQQAAITGGVVGLIAGGAFGLFADTLIIGGFLAYKKQKGTKPDSTPPSLQSSTAPTNQHSPVVQPISSPAPLPMKKTCPRCSASNPMGQDFCGNCGEPLPMTNYQKSSNIHGRAIAISSGIGIAITTIVGLVSNVLGVSMMKSLGSSAGQTQSEPLLWVTALFGLGGCFLMFLILGGVGTCYAYFHSQRLPLTTKHGVLGGAISAVIVATIGGLINGVVGFIITTLFSLSNTTASLGASMLGASVVGLLIGIPIGLCISLMEGSILGAIGGAIGSVTIGRRQTTYQ